MKEEYKLHLGIYDGDIQVLPFETKRELVSYTVEMQKTEKDFDCVWLVSVDSEILITESIKLITNFIGAVTLLKRVDCYDYHIHEYQSYEDAYAVALSMKETNPKCYNK